MKEKKQYYHQTDASGRDALNAVPCPSALHSQTCYLRYAKQHHEYVSLDRACVIFWQVMGCDLWGRSIYQRYHY